MKAMFRMLYSTLMLAYSILHRKCESMEKVLVGAFSEYCTKYC